MKHITSFSSVAEATACPGLYTPQVCMIEGTGEKMVFAKSTPGRIDESIVIVEDPDTGEITPEINWDEPALNEIYYWSFDDEPYPIEDIIETIKQKGISYTGPEVIYNDYDENADCFIMRFDRKVTSLGAANIEISAVNGPFFINDENMGISCNVEEVVLPNSVTKIETFAFLGFEGNTVVLPIKIPIIDDFAFVNCTGGEEDNGCTYIGDVMYTANLRETRVEIKEGTRYICAEAIVNTEKTIEEINIPSTVEIIGSDMIFNGEFGGTIYIDAETPPILMGILSGQGLSNTCNIFVPAQSINAYKSAPGWSQYADRIQAIQ